MNLIDEALKKEYGLEIFSSASRFIEKEPDIINVTPSMDIMLGGGIPSGSFVVIAGPPKVGKSSMCLHIAKKAQKLGYTIFYLNIEGRIKKRDLLGIKGLDLSHDKFIIVGSDENRILVAEDYLDILVSLIKTKKRCLFIADSISQLCSEGRSTGKVGDRFRDDVPLMLASLTKVIANILPIRDNILVCITHIIANQGQGYSPWMEASGQKVQYQADVKLRATHKEEYKVSDADKPVGQIIHWRCDTSALNSPPGVTASSLLRYGNGIDEYYDLLSSCIDMGLVKKVGAWYTFPDGQKAQGIEKARALLSSDEKLYESLNKSFQEIFK